MDLIQLRFVVASKLYSTIVGVYYISSLVSFYYHHKKGWSERHEWPRAKLDPLPETLFSNKNHFANFTFLTGKFE